MKDENGIWKLIDFGLAKVLEEKVEKVENEEEEVEKEENEEEEGLTDDLVVEIENISQYILN